jgi:hypothetical protein
MWSLAAVAVAAALGGCTLNDSEPASDRDRMIGQAHDAYRSAVAQGVNLRRTPCIYDDGGEWVVVVDFEHRTLREAASECPTFATGRAAHAVILDSDGEVVAAQ